MIPKKIHQVWLGDNEIPKQFLEWSNEWREKNPDFQYKLWTSNEFGENSFVKKWKELGDYRFVCDYVRAKILHSEGGVYVDVDIKPYKPINKDLLDCEFFVTRTGGWWYMNGFMGSVKGSRGLTEVIREYDSYEQVVKLFEDYHPELVAYKNEEEYLNEIWADGQIFQRVLPRAYEGNGILINVADGQFINNDPSIIKLIESDVMHLVPQYVDPLTLSRINLIGIHRPKI